MAAGMVRKVLDFAAEPRKRARIEAWLNRREQLAFAESPRTHPSILYLETCTTCNLRCPFCPTGNGTSQLKKELLTPAAFERIASRLRLNLLREVHLYNWGEPYLNPHVHDYVRYFHDRGIRTFISSNFSVKAYNREFLGRIVWSGLDVLTVSLDGARQETYEKYRVRGNFADVVANMRGLSKIKRESRSDHPRIIYRMLLNRYNEADVEDARKIAREVGAEFLADENFYAPAHLAEEWIAESVKAKWGIEPPAIHGRAPQKFIHTECRQLWDTLLVNTNGDVFPCCLISNPQSAVGNLVAQDFEEIWNGEKMRALRRFATDPSAPEPAFPNDCAACGNRYCLRA